MIDDEDWDDDEEDPWETDDETAVVPCPICHMPVFEDAERCPSCGDYLVHRRSPWSERPWWWVALGLLGSGALIYWLLA